MLSILLESVFKLLIESSLDFFDLSLEKHFFNTHQKIFKVIARKQPEEAGRLVKEDIPDVMEKLKAHKKFIKGV